MFLVYDSLYYGYTVYWKLETGNWKAVRCGGTQGYQVAMARSQSMNHSLDGLSIMDEVRSIV